MGKSDDFDRDAVSPTTHAATGDEKHKPEVDYIDTERAQSPELEKSRQNYSKVDKELAQYVSDVRIDISPEENKRLLKMIDKRILAIMITTYFLQAIDKGTLSFASIMGIREDTGLKGQEVRPPTLPPFYPFQATPY
jgi:hypothetical protein